MSQSPPAEEGCDEGRKRTFLMSACQECLMFSQIVYCTKSQDIIELTEKGTAIHRFHLNKYCLILEKLDQMTTISVVISSCSFYYSYHYVEIRVRNGSIICPQQETQLFTRTSYHNLSYQQLVFSTGSQFTFNTSSRTWP